MVRITDFEYHGSLVCVCLDSGEKYWLKKNDLSGSCLSENLEMEMEEFLHFIRIHQYPKALNQAVAMLARRPCSKGEILTRLQRGRYTDEVIELVIYKLEKENLLNDRDFCEQWIQYRLGRKYGPAFIHRELKTKGIPEELICSSLESQDQSQELINAVSVARKAWCRMKTDSDQHKNRQKVISALVRKGYSWEMAKEACCTAEKEL